MKAFTEPFSFVVPVILACAVSFDLSTGFSSSRRSWRAYTVKDSGRQKTDSNFVYTHTTRSRDLKIDASSLAIPFDTRLVPDVKVRMSSTYGKHLPSDQGSRPEEALYSEYASLHSFDVMKMCQEQRRSLVPHPHSCAWYINCTMIPDAVQMTYFNSFVRECPYPQLFSAVTLQCQDFNDVRCEGRFEPKSPCEYRANRCRESSHCIPCWVRYASCRGLSEGLNPWKGMEWQPFFVECHKERTVFQGHCHSNAVFSPMTRACETPMSIPSEHGGWKPGCLGRRDGLYPDEFGRCDLYFLCQGQLFRGFHSCKNGRKFNPFTSNCESVENVPFPCGDRTEDKGICQRKEDGNYLDIFGRCNHYFTCRNQTMAGLHVCTKGVFNVFTGRCDSSKRARSQLARPCGETENECLNKSDGIHQNQRADSRVKCQKHVVCEKGLVISTRLICTAIKTHRPPQVSQ